jgi:hypothetical protein
MGINRRLVRAREQLSKGSLTRTGFWEDIMPRINQGIVIPIISNSFRIEQIFREEKREADPSESAPSEEDLTVEEQLAEEWANFV